MLSEPYSTTKTMKRKYAKYNHDKISYNTNNKNKPRYIIMKISGVVHL